MTCRESLGVDWITSVATVSISTLLNKFNPLPQYFIFYRLGVIIAGIVNVRECAGADSPSLSFATRRMEILLLIPSRIAISFSIIAPTMQRVAARIRSYRIIVLVTQLSTL